MKVKLIIRSTPEEIEKAVNDFLELTTVKVCYTKIKQNFVVRHINLEEELQFWYIATIFYYDILPGR